jgi:hypothetical protein
VGGLGLAGPGRPCAVVPLVPWLLGVVRGGGSVGRSGGRWWSGPSGFCSAPHCLIFSVFPTRYLIVDRWRLPYFAGPPMRDHGVRPINAWERTRLSTGNCCCAVDTATVHCHSPSCTVPESARTLPLLTRREVVSVGGPPDGGICWRFDVTPLL